MNTPGNGSRPIPSIDGPRTTGGPRTTPAGGRSRCGGRSRRSRRAAADRPGRRRPRGRARSGPRRPPAPGIPSRSASRNGVRRPDESSSLSIVVDSPPGSTIASIPASCSGVLTSVVCARATSSASACSRNAPCSASTPIFISGGLPSLVTSRARRASRRGCRSRRRGIASPNPRDTLATMSASV